MEKKNEQHSRQKFIEEQLNALKQAYFQEEKALNDARLTLLNQKWQVQSERDKLQKKVDEEKDAPVEVEASSKETTPEPSTSSK
ncbi:hypothetical protein CAEBREN_32415 [Caenorhabditis brenneri]|uniref:Uncharacterized protein n=1 Tax=Caenorhabditis brenneri TaxID=135651 RepID=G0MJM4_CAEBE|nr:hypothetical protein CAEBREN_32415 [Caenorhabditis brenneri]